MTEEVITTEENTEVIDYRTLTDTDEHGTEWVNVEYTYECPTDDYLDGETLETITTRYIGPKELYLWVEKDTGNIKEVYRKWEALDGRTVPGDYEVVILNATEDPLACEVLSDYHDNYKDMEDYTETPGTKTIPVPEGYEAFEYEYPIHPDVLFDNFRSTYNFDTEKVVLHRNKNIDIIGEPNTWDQIRVMRNERLAATDTLWLVLKDIDPERWAKIDDYRKKLRDLPDKLKDVPLIYVDSCFPMTDAIF